MMRTIYLALACLLSLASPAEAQINKAEATLYLRQAEDKVQAAIEIDIEHEWHLYHKELGDDPNATGKPTVIKFLYDGEETEDIEWGDVWFPEPIVGIQKGLALDGGDAKILEHKGRIMLYALGTPDGEVDLDLVTVDLEGLTCQDDGMCIPYEEEIESEGKGASRIWKDFPAELAAAEEEAAAGPPQRARAKLYTRIKDAHEIRAVIEVEMDEHWHIYHEDIGDGLGVGTPTKIALSADNVTWGLLIWPKPYVLEQPGLGLDPDTGDFVDAWIFAHEGKIVIKTSGLIAEGAAPGSVTASFDALVCEDGGVCIPLEYELESKGKGPDEYFAEPYPPYAPADTVATVAGEGEEENATLWQFLLFAIGAGLLTLLMPCTYPMIPITISFFTKQAEARNGNVLPLSLTYGFGIVLIFVLIGVLVGPIILLFATHWLTNLVIGVMFVYFALVLFGFINLQPPQALMQVAGKASMTGGYIGVFLMGATLVVTSFTCTAPFVGSLLAAGATGAEGSSDLVRVALGMGVFGLTMAIPFVILSLIPGKVSQMPRSGEWMNTLKKTLGFVEIAAALKFFSNVDLNLNLNVFPAEIFLVLWAVIMVAAAVFLLGFFSKGSKISMARRFAGVVFLLLGGYWGYGAFNRPVLDKYTIAFASPYWINEVKDSHEVVKDDYVAALALAKEQQKKLFINFTGFA